MSVGARMDDHRVLRGYLRLCAGLFAIVAAVFTLVAFVVPPLALGAATAAAGVYAAIRLSRSPLRRRELMGAVAVHVVAMIGATTYAFTALKAGGSADAYEPLAVQVFFLGFAAVLGVAAIAIGRVALRRDA